MFWFEDGRIVSAELADMNVTDQIRAEVREGAGLFFKTLKLSGVACAFLAPIASAILHVKHGSPIADCIIAMLLSIVLGGVLGIFVGLFAGAAAVLHRIVGMGWLVAIVATLLGGWTSLWLCAPLIDPDATSRTDGALGGILAVGFVLAMIFLPQLFLDSKALVFVGPALLTSIAVLLGMVVGAIVSAPILIALIVSRARYRAKHRSSVTEPSP